MFRQKNENNRENKEYFSLVPRSILTAERYEFTNTRMEVDGVLPDDLVGHVFFIEPSGSVESGGLPYPNGNSVLAGDGMIYRLDFKPKSEVRLNSRLVKPPDYYADKLTYSNPKYNKYCFHSYGITRLSFSLGCRNQLNTAFLPMQFSGDSTVRLLVTYDAGRPYEIDPVTLNVVTPVGSTKEWRTQLEGLKVPFELYMSTAHPVFDVYTSKMFTVNYGRSLSNFLKTIPFIKVLDENLQKTNMYVSDFVKIFKAGIFNKTWQNFNLFFDSFFQSYVDLIKYFIGIEMNDFLYLISWDGIGELERWKLVLEDGSSIKINQSIHQIGVTQDYIVIMDTAFSVGINEIIDNLIPSLRQSLEIPAVPDSNIYIVRRSDLILGQRPASDSHEVEVVAQKVVIPFASAHFLVDYDNPEGNITLHTAHICAMKVSDWLRKYDMSAYPPHNFISSHLYGMIHNEVDISRLGKYVIHGKTGDIVESSVIYDKNCTWGLELYSYLERLPTGLKPRKLDQIYWCSLGLWQELMTKFIFDLHNDYKYQVIPRSEILDLAKKGLPSCLFRLDTQLMKIVDSYSFPDGHMVLSPQFIPRGDGENSKNGYLFCTVWFNNDNEFWIFDAQDLKKGPLCKLRHPSLSFGLTLHSVWLPEINSRTANYFIEVRQDYEHLVNQQSQEIQELFEEIYPYVQV